MTASTKRCYEMAKQDTLFHDDMKKSASNFKIPNWFSSKLQKVLFAVAYFGWLVGKGKYEGETKRYLSELDEP